MSIQGELKDEGDGGRVDRSDKRGQDMLLLDEGDWVGYSCLGRAIGKSAGSMAWVIALGAFAIAIAVARERLWSPSSTPAPQATTVMVWCGGVILLAMACFAVASGLGRDRDILFAEAGELVERGCYRLTRFEDRFDLAATTISYRHREKRGYDLHLMILKPPGAGRSLTIDLTRPARFHALTRLAPDVMRAFAKTRATSD